MDVVSIEWGNFLYDFMPGKIVKHHFLIEQHEI